MNESNNNICDYLLKTAFITFLLGVGVILPLCFNDYLYDLMETKAIYYFWISILVCIFLLLFVFFSFIYKKRLFSKDPLLLSIVTFSIFSLISTILSYSPSMAFFGDNGWFIGSYVIASIVFIVFCLSKYKIKNNKIFIPLLIVISIVLIIAITDAFELDLLKFGNDNHYIKNHGYVSLIGNVNYYVGYLSLIMPLFCGLYLVEEETINKRIYFVLSILSISNVAFLKSDGIYLAIGLLSFFIIPFIFNNLQRIKRFSYLLFSYSICLIISRILNFYMDGYSAYTRKMYVIIPLLLLSVYLYFFSTSTKNKKYDKYKNKLIVIIEIILAISCIALFVSVIPNIDIDWGNGRFIIWKRSFEGFKEFSIKNKLIGVGPELLYNVYSSLYDQLGFVLCSHSEPIQVLLSLGIIGFVSYYMCWIIIFIKFYKTNNKKIIPFYFGMICYFGQSFVNSATTLNVATLALFIILTYSLNIDD